MRDGWRERDRGETQQHHHSIPAGTHGLGFWPKALQVVACHSARWFSHLPAPGLRFASTHSFGPSSSVLTLCCKHSTNIQTATHPSYLWYLFLPSSGTRGAQGITRNIPTTAPWDWAPGMKLRKLELHEVYLGTLLPFLAGNLTYTSRHWDSQGFLADSDQLK